MKRSTESPITTGSLEPIVMDENDKNFALMLAIYGKESALEAKDVTITCLVSKAFNEMSSNPELPADYYHDKFYEKCNSSATNEQSQVTVKWKNLFTKCMNDLHQLNKAKKEMVEKTEHYIVTKQQPNFMGTFSDLFNAIRKHSIPLAQTDAQNEKAAIDAIANYCLKVLNSKDKAVNKNEVYTLLKGFDLTLADANPLAQYCLGVCYKDGLGTNQNLKQALPFLIASGEKGNKDAQYLLGLEAQQRGNLKKAFELFQKSAEQGNADAQNNLGFFYQKGMGIPVDLDKAIHFYKLAGDQGNITALSNLGFVYETILKDDSETFIAYKKAADLGDALAQQRISYFYQMGVGTNENRREAFKYSKLSADQGNKDSQLTLAFFYKEGYGIEVSKEQYIKYLTMAAHSGNPKAINILGSCYLNGSDVQVNLNEAIKWLKKNADSINENVNQDEYSRKAQYMLSQCYEAKGNLYEAFKYLDAANANGSIDALRALNNYLDKYQLKAKEKDSDAQYMMSLLRSGRYKQNLAESFTYAVLSAAQGNAKGQNQEGYLWQYRFKDPVKAFPYYELSAKQGNSDALNNLGRCYEFGLGTNIDMLNAFDAFKSSAEQGNERGQLSLANFYILGRPGIPQNYTEAFKYYTLSADQGNVEAINNLGYMYQVGLGTPINLEVGFGLIKTAADQGNAGAQVNVGICFQNGTGTKVDDKEAFKYYKLAADQGDAFGQNSLGWFYEQGKGTQVNMELAYKYTNLSAAQGNVAALQRLATYHRMGLQNQFQQ